MLTVLRWDDPWFPLVIFSSWYNSFCHLNVALSRYTFTEPVSQTWWLNINWALIVSFLMIISPSNECMSLKKVFQSWRNQTELYILITWSSSAKVPFMRNYSYTNLWKNNKKMSRVFDATWFEKKCLRVEWWWQHPFFSKQRIKHNWFWTNFCVIFIRN